MPHAPRLSHCALLALSLLLTPAARAATGVSMDVSRVELSALPGGTVNHAVTVLNPGGASEGAMTVSPSLRDFVLPPQGQAQFLPAGTGKNSLARWLQFTPQEFKLAPGQKQQVRYTVQVPANAAPGLYWGVLFFRSDTPAAPASGENSVSLNYTIDVGQIIYVQVGTPTVEARLNALEASYADGQISVGATVKNSGSGLIRAAGRAQVLDGQGRPVALLPIEESVALPGYSRTFSGHAGLALGPGQYQVLVALQYAKGKFFTGQTRLVVK
ncbi:hypothetical protein DAETH_31780 [Deinococcus aetherius]|uniref:P pilus assembly protein, chaperone PapD n=1 Tax=Deinococcus aetherius TaxID=200252 RepID=A0ABN6RKE9_9DEIO|nr:hypothetical protein [Deinococcus aetherius]BDP43209.1 hypothetical protein DAETH_31780 [Deinococcus aetherius]